MSVARFTKAPSSSLQESSAPDGMHFLYLPAGGTIPGWGIGGFAPNSLAFLAARPGSREAGRRLNASKPMAPEGPLAIVRNMPSAGTLAVNKQSSYTSTVNPTVPARSLQLLAPVLEVHLLPKLALADVQALEWVYRAAGEQCLDDAALLRIVQERYSPAIGCCHGDFRQQLHCTSRLQHALKLNQLHVIKQLDCQNSVYLETAQLSPCGSCMASMSASGTTFHMLSAAHQAVKPLATDAAKDAARTCGAWSHDGRLFAQASCRPSGDSGMHISLAVHTPASQEQTSCSGPDVLQPPGCVWAVGDTKFSPDDRLIAVVSRKAAQGPQLLHIFGADCSLVSHHLLRPFPDWQWLPCSRQLLLAHPDQLATLHVDAAQPPAPAEPPTSPQHLPHPVLLEVSPQGTVAALFCSELRCQLFLVEAGTGRQLHASSHAGGRGQEGEYQQHLGLALASHAVALSAFSPYRQDTLEPTTTVLAYHRGLLEATPMFECMGKWPSWSPDSSILVTIRGALVHLVHGSTGVLLRTWSPYCHVPPSWRISCRTLGEGRVQPVAWRMSGEHGCMLHISAPALLPADHGTGTGTIIWVVQCGQLQ